MCYINLSFSSMGSCPEPPLPYAEHTGATMSDTPIRVLITLANERDYQQLLNGLEDASENGHITEPFDVQRVDNADELLGFHEVDDDG